MDNSEENLSFFKRLKIAIFNLEEYGRFLGEKVSKSIKYFLLLILLITIGTTVADSYKFYGMLNTGINYITNELPEFSYNDGNLKFENNVQAYDHKYKFKLYINTDDTVSEETLNSYKQDLYSTESGVILLKDKLTFSLNGNSVEKTYKEIFNVEEMPISNKQDLLEKVNNFDTSGVITTYGIFEFIILYMASITEKFMDLILIAVFGYVASRLCGVRFKMSPMITLSVYSLTLSLVLRGIYDIVWILTGFVIKYFNVMYLLIAYVYIIAAIFMIKYDLIKQSQELQRIIEVQKQVRKEANEENNEENEDTKDKKDDKKEEPPAEVPKEEENKEPDGSEI